MRSEVCRRSASPRCRKPRAAAALLLVSLGGLFACSTPAEFETAPEFLGLQPAFYSVSAPTSGTRLPDDSCPRALPTLLELCPGEGHEDDDDIGDQDRRKDDEQGARREFHDPVVRSWER